MNAEAHTLIGAYVLDAVDDLERAAFDRHLGECETCRFEVDELREASARLADGAWSVPPPALRDNVLAAISTTRQLGPPAPAPSAAARRPVSRRRLLTAAAAVVVAAAGAASATYEIQDRRVRREQTDAAAARRSESRVRALLAAPDLVVNEQPLSTGGRVTVASSRSNNAGLIMLAADAAPTGDRVYQLWTIHGQTPVSAGALAVGQTTAVQIVEGLPAANAVGVTVEPAPRSAAPTSPILASVKLT
jgi:anti-sigma factor RsiW